MIRALLIPGILLLIPGCDTLEHQVADPEPSIADGGQLVGPNPMKGVVDLVSILDPKGHAVDQSGEEWDNLPQGRRIDLALVAFYDRSVYSENLKVRRNRVQERLLSESNRRCNVFKSILYQIRSKTNFVLGALSTITGVAGSIVTGVDGSRILSGTSGIFGGLRAELNQELFQNLATQVIVQGIDTRRRQIYDKIVTQGQAKSATVYPVEAAIKDAIFYHGQCSVIVGFEVARDSIQTVEDPGLNVANRILAKLATTRKLLDIEEITPEEATRTLDQGRGDLPLAGTTLSAVFGAESPLQSLRNASEAIKVNAASLSAAIERLTAPDAQRNSILELLPTVVSEARSGLETCNTLALDASRNILVAQQRVDATTAGTVADIFAANTALEDARVEGQAASERINLIPELFASRIARAYDALNKARRELKTSDAVRESTLGEIQDPLKGFPPFENCRPKTDPGTNSSSQG